MKNAWQLDLTTRRIFLLEDDLKKVDQARQMFEDIGKVEVKWIHAPTLEEARRILEDSEPWSFDLLLFDLMVPRRPGEPFDRLRDAQNGLEALETAHARGHKSGLFVVSHLADGADGVAALARLRDRGIELEDFLSKDRDLQDVKDWEAHFGVYLEDIEAIREHLKKELGLSIVHRAQLTILWKIKRHLAQALETARQDRLKVGLLPFLFEGDPGTGKTHWARATAHLKAMLAARWIGSEPAVRFVSLPLTIFSDRFDDSANIRMFGARDYNQISSDGAFIRASFYQDAKCGQEISDNRGNHKGPVVKYTDVDAVKAIPLRGGVVLGDELLRATKAVHDVLLSVVQDMEAHVVGACPFTIPIHCTPIFATDQDVDRAFAEGNLSRALFSRLKPRRIRMPSLREMGWPATFQILGEMWERRTLGQGSVQGKDLGALRKKLREDDAWIAPPARELLREALDEGSVDYRILQRVVEGAGTSERITPGVVLHALPRAKKGAVKAPPPRPEPHDAQATTGHEATGPHKEAPLPGFEEAITVWKDLVSGKKKILNLTEAIGQIDVSPSLLRKVLVVAYGELSLGQWDGRTRDFYRLLGTTRVGLVNKLKSLSGNYGAAFMGRTPTDPDDFLKIKELKVLASERLKGTHPAGT
ncbi:MAG: sigma 54-interacting transcriptional regulator [Planctomycetes bacterium]|nr:sigma 54-interacting transcriptional regulator [Planctomycetota bacterium]